MNSEQVNQLPLQSIRISLEESRSPEDAENEDGRKRLEASSPPNIPSLGASFKKKDEEVSFRSAEDREGEGLADRVRESILLPRGSHLEEEMPSISSASQRPLEH